LLMHKPLLVAVAVCLSPLSSPSARAQALNPCDLNADGKVDMLDVQLATNMALGATPCTANIAGSGVCDVVFVQRVINALLNGTCASGLLHTVSLTWTASTSSNVVGYNVYRGTTAGGPYNKLTSSAVAGTAYTDNAVDAGKTYYYVATAVDGSGNESVYSSEAMAVIPTP
jgi:hypothetical protein